MDDNIQLCEKNGDLLVSFDTAKLFLRHQQARAYPAFPLIAWVAALHIKANPFDDGESRLDHIGVGQRHPQLLWNMKPVYRQRFLQCTWQRWIGAASPAYFFTAACSALPPSRT